MMRFRGTLRMLLLLALLISGPVFAVRFLTPQYFSFRHRSEKYYAEFTTACESLLTQYPVGTNSFIELNGTDVSIPKIIRDLHPVRIKVAQDRVWILHPGGTEFGVTWERQGESQT